MKKNTARIIVKIIAIILILKGIFGLLGSLGLAIFGSKILLGTPIGAGLIIFFTILVLLISIFYIITGLHLWKFKNWARISTIILAILSGLSFPISDSITLLSVIIIISVAFMILIIYFLGFNKRVKSLF